MAKKSRTQIRRQRHDRVRAHIAGTADRPRLSVYRSLSDIYVQVIDDASGCTLASASTIDHELRQKMAGLNKTEQARQVGQAIAKRAADKGVRQVVFDRGGYKYFGRVKALADAAREGGLEF